MMEHGTNEPSVLDYVKSKLFFWRGEKIVIPNGTGEEAWGTLPLAETAENADFQEVPGKAAANGAGFRTLFQPAHRESLRVVMVASLALVFALVGQLALEPPTRGKTMGILFYLFVAGWMGYLAIKGYWRVAEMPDEPTVSEPMTVNKTGLWLSVPLILAAFVSLGGNRFTGWNIFLWGLALAAFLWTFWLPESTFGDWKRKITAAIRSFLRDGFALTPWQLLLLAVFALAAFYRFYRLDQVPMEMFSDHAEKLLDVMDVLAGKTHIFFTRNTGREAFQFYLTAAIIKLFGTGVSFLSLKLGTGLAGLFTLPFIYLLGKEIANRRTGLLAMLFAGMAYWLNVISRVALRFTLYPFFAAPALYFFVRGLRRRSRNDLILSGVAVGLGLHGYSPARFVPIVIVAGILIYLVHKQSQGGRKQAFLGLLLIGFVSLVVFLPLLRFMMSNPDMFMYRTMTRISSVEHPLPGPAWQIFVKNLGDVLVMFFWDNGEIWVHSIPHRPALGVVSAVFLFFGTIGLIVRYLRKRHWVDLFLLVSIPLLMMPSVLSLAFPAENPSLNRTGAAAIPVFILVGLGLDSFLKISERHIPRPGGKRLAMVLGIALVFIAAKQNYDLVFHQYDQEFRLGAWNTSELGHVIRTFADTIGNKDSAWVIPYPYWVDTRLVGINAGFPDKDYALWVDNLDETLPISGAKMFLLKPEDRDALDDLMDLYPTGSLKLYRSGTEGKNFWIYFVPPEK